jgi:hypothetical protein
MSSVLWFGNADTNGALATGVRDTITQIGRD